jgi:polysaccharide export outer membrane protein
MTDSGCLKGFNCRRAVWLVLVFTGLVVAACSTVASEKRLGTPDFTPNSSIKGAGTTIGVGDTFEVRVYGEQDLSGTYRVSTDGMIIFPLVGKIMVVGLSANTLAEQLTEKLRNGILKDPQVSIFIKEFNSKKVFVFGEVNRPGTFQYDEDMTIIQAVTVAGGFTKGAERNKVSVTRIEDGVEKRVFLSVEEIGRGKEKNFFLKPGDIIYVPESFF